MSIEAYPLNWPLGWPRKDGYLISSSIHRYKRGLTIAEARDGLLSELNRLGASNIIVSSNMALRNDGLMRASQRKPDDPGVAVYFDWNGKPMVMAMDDFHEVQGNIRRLAMAVKALRDLERNGGGTMIERAFTGFEALPAPDSIRAHDVLGCSERADKDEVARAYRHKAKECHPDSGGSIDLMSKLNAARDEMMGSNYAP